MRITDTQWDELADAMLWVERPVNLTQSTRVGTSLSGRIARGWSGGAVHDAFALREEAELPPSDRDDVAFLRSLLDVCREVRRTPPNPLWEALLASRDDGSAWWSMHFWPWSVTEVGSRSDWRIHGALAGDTVTVTGPPGLRSCIPEALGFKCSQLESQVLADVKGATAARVMNTLPQYVQRALAAQLLSDVSLTTYRLDAGRRIYYSPLYTANELPEGEC